MDLEKLPSFLSLISLLLISVFAYFEAKKENRGNRKLSPSSIAKAGVFGALSALLYVVPIFTIKLPFFPEFLTLHFDEVPALLIGLSEGPLCAFLVLLAKTFIKLPFTSTATVGEWADLILSCLLILPVCLLYRKKKSKKAMLLGFAISLPTHLVLAMVLNVYVLIPFFSVLYGLPLDALLAICQAAIPAIQDVGWSYAFFAVLPFNALKDAIVIVLSCSFYGGLRYFLERNR